MTITHERCFYCNKVSSKDIETNAEEFTKKRFFRDPQLDTRLTCEDCKEVIEELMLDYEGQDDVYGWSIANDNRIEGLLDSLPEEEEIEVQDYEFES